MAFEGAGQREFTQLVTDHLVRHINRHVLLAVVHSDRQTDEFGQDRRATRPGLDGLLVLVGNRLVDLSREVVVNLNCAIYLDVPFDETYSRLAVRNGFPTDPDAPSNLRYTETQRHYQRTCTPAERAGIVVDNTDPANPRIVVVKRSVSFDLHLIPVDKYLPWRAFLQKIDALMHRAVRAVETGGAN